MKKKEKSPWLRIALALVLGGAGYLSGYFMVNTLGSALPLKAFGPQGGAEKLLYIALTLLAAWGVILVHELGHLCAGLAQGFRLALFTAGLLGVRGSATGPRFFLNRQLSLMGGLAASFPERLETGPALRRKFARIVAAGPLASLLLGLLAFWALGWVPAQTPSLLARAGGFYLMVTGLLSIIIFLATIVPARMGGFMSDGARLLSLLNKGEQARYEEASLAVGALTGAGKLPGDYPADLIAQLLQRPPDSLLGLNGHFVAFSHYLDRGETPAALALAQGIETHIDVVPEAFQGYYLKDVAFFHAFLAKDAAAAQATWAGLPKAAGQDADAGTFRTKAALALLDGQPDTAATLARQGLASTAELPFEGQRRFEEKWLTAVLAEAEAASKTDRTTVDPASFSNTPRETRNPALSQLIPFIRARYRAEITEPEFLSHIQQQLDASRQTLAELGETLLRQQDAEGLDYWLFLLATLRQEADCIGGLHRFLLAPWHYSYEEIIHRLQVLRNPASIPFIRDAMQQRFAYLESTGTGTRQFINQCGHALRSIGTPEAIAVITELSRSADPILQDEMLYRLSKIEGRNDYVRKSGEQA